MSMQFLSSNDNDRRVYFWTYAKAFYVRRMKIDFQQVINNVPSDFSPHARHMLECFSSKEFAEAKGISIATQQLISVSLSAFQVDR